jgi:hypothetical protein
VELLVVVLVLAVVVNQELVDQLLVELAQQL